MKEVLVIMSAYKRDYFREQIEAIKSQKGILIKKIILWQNEDHVNVDYLRENNLLVDEIYNGTNPMGIFAIINKTEELLFSKNIGAVGLDKFVNSEKEHYKKFSRICVSVNNELFKEFIRKII